MKKFAIVIAAASALATPLAATADTILYGSARVSVDYNDDKSPVLGDPNARINANWDVVDNSSRLGVQGIEDLGGGLSAVYKYEFGVDTTEGGNFDNTSKRPKFVGLKGGFGTLTLGTHETPYYRVAEIVDTFNTAKSLGKTAWLGGSFDGFNLDVVSDERSGSGLFRMDNSVLYTTPDFNGFSGEAMLVMNGNLNDAQGYSNNIDMWNVAAKYNNGPFFAGISYIALDGNRILLETGTSFDLDLDQWDVGLGYSSGPFSLGFIYESGKINLFGLLNTTEAPGIRLSNDTPNNWYLTGEYRFGNNTLRAAYGQLDTKMDLSGFDNKIDNYLAGYQYDFSRRTRVWVEYIGRSSDSVLYRDQNAVSIGTRHDF